MNRGEVYRYNYLWGHEAEQQRENSRKIRRVCLMMQIDGWLYLFPITSLEPQPEEPGDERLYEVIPEIEKRRIGLRSEKVSYLILDDYNRVRSDKLYDFESLEPVGMFSLKFMERVGRRFRDAMRENRPIQGLTRN